MTRKTWPLFLGSFVVPALLIAACSADTDDDDDGDNGGSGNSDTSGAGSTRNSTTARTGSGNTNTGATTGRFGTSTNRSNSGGVLNRGGASAGGRSNQFNTAGAIAKAGSGNNVAGSAGKASGAAGMAMAGANSGSGGANSTTGTTSTANGGSATGGTTAVAAAGAAGASAICPDGCASIGLTLTASASAEYAVEISPTVTYTDDDVTLSASLYAPGAQNGRVRLVILNADGDDCPSNWSDLNDVANGFGTITANLNGCNITQASLVGIRVRNNTTDDKTYSLYVNALTLASTTPPKNVTWTPASAAAISATAPDVGILGPVTAVAGATLTYLND